MTMVMTVCFELKLSPFEAEQLYVDEIDHLSIIPYYKEIQRQVKELKQDR